MPELSRFFGIIITMYAEGSEKHREPHFHARYQGRYVSISIQSGEILAGKIAGKQSKLVQKWRNLHIGELEQAWETLLAGDIPDSIEPLN